MRYRIDRMPDQTAVAFVDDYDTLVWLTHHMGLVKQSKYTFLAVDQQTGKELAHVTAGEVSEHANIAQRATDALLQYSERQTNKLQGLEELVAELVAAIAELDARTYHVQR